MILRISFLPVIRFATQICFFICLLHAIKKTPLGKGDGVTGTCTYVMSCIKLYVHSPPQSSPFYVRQFELVLYVPFKTHPKEGR